MPQTEKFQVAIKAGPDRPGENGWRGRHHRAIVLPNAIERPIVLMLEGWYDYAVQHRVRFDSKIGDDGFLGQHWEAIGDALRALLNGDCGRLDCGTVDAFLLDTMADNSVETENK
jgi:hypothetical protein